MIPILYTEDERNFVTEGVGRIDCVTCLVTEEKNSIPECEFTVPITAEIFPKIKHGMIIYTTHDETKDPQPYEIYAHTAPLDDLVTFYARHIATRLNNIIVEPYTAADCPSAVAGIVPHSLNANAFSFWTDKETVASFKVKTPKIVTDILGGSEGSLLDTFGHGEYEFDDFAVRLYSSRGQDTDIEIRYGSNLIDFTQEEDSSGIYNVVMPYWCDSEGNVAVTLPEKFVVGSGSMTQTAYLTADTGEDITDEYGEPIEVEYAKFIYAPLDLTESFDETPTVAQLRAKAQSYLDTNKPWLPSNTIDIDFVALWQTEEYASVAPLQRIKLWDTVVIVYPDLGYTARVPVVKTVYDSLFERYDSMQLGDSSATIESVIRDEIPDLPTDYVDEGTLSRAISYATEQLTGNMGGSHIVFKLNADGGMEEMYIMDTDDETTAMNVWRFNSAGWGHSSTGINGPYTLAALQNGSIVADAIVTGTLNGAAITVINLTATNVDLTGTFKSVNTNDGGITYVKTAGSGWGVFRTSDDLRLAGMGYVYANGTLYGGGLVGFNTNGNRVYQIGASTGYNGALDLFWKNGVQMWSFGNNGGWFINNANQNYLKLGAYNNAGGLWLINTDSENDIIQMYDNGTSGGDGGAIVLRDHSNVRDFIAYISNYVGNIILYDSGIYGAWLSADDGLRIGNYNGAHASHYAKDSWWIYDDNLELEGQLTSSGDFWVRGDISCYGSKNRSVITEDYGTKLLYSYETASPMFGDIGEGQIDEIGVCYIWIDPVFAETVRMDHYQVFLQPYGQGDCYVAERTSSYFKVCGTAGLSFGWEIKAKQRSYENARLEKARDYTEKPGKTVDYSSDAIAHINQIYQDRGLTNHADSNERNAI